MQNQNTIEAQVLRSSDSEPDWRGLLFGLVRCLDVGRTGSVEYVDFGQGLMIRGKSKAELTYPNDRNRELHFTPGTYCSYPPGHRWDEVTANGSTELLNSTVPEAGLEAKGLLRTRRPDPGMAIPCSYDPTVHALGLQILNKLENGCESGVLFAERICLALLGRIDGVARGRGSSLRRYAVRQLVGPIARHVRDSIKRNLGHERSIVAITRVVGMGERNLSICFRNTLGMPVHRYVPTYRLDTAATMLATTRRSLSEIASSYGFSSQSYVGTVILGAIGLTTVRYRGHRLAMSWLSVVDSSSDSGDSSASFSCHRAASRRPWAALPITNSRWNRLRS